MMLNEYTVAQAEEDIQLLTNPGHGGFNMCYNDNWFAQSLVTKWGMSLDELVRRVKEIKKPKE